MLEGHHAVAERQALQDRNALLEACVHVLRGTLMALVHAKDWKDRYGKDETYRRLQPDAWRDARAAIKFTEQAASDLAAAQTHLLASANVLAQARGTSDEEAAWDAFLANLATLNDIQKGSDR